MIIDSGIATGSLTVSSSLLVSGSSFLNGDTQITGSLTVSGVVIATISGSTTSASYAETASFAPNYLPLAGGTISGNLIVAGTASISYLDVTFESASIIYSSGSNILGDTENDTQTLYGTVVIPTGSFTVTGSAAVSEGIYGTLYGTADTAINAPYYVLTASYNADSSSFSSRVTNVESTASVLTTASASFALVSSSYSSTSGSLSTRTTNLESTASVLINASASFATDISNIQGLTGSYATTGSNTFIGSQTIDGNLLMQGTSRLIYNNNAANNMLFGMFDGGTIYGPYYQIFGNSYSNLTQRGSAEFVYDNRNGGGSGFNIASFNGSSWTRKFRTDDQGTQVTGSLQVTEGITGSFSGSLYNLQNSIVGHIPFFSQSQILTDSAMTQVRNGDGSNSIVINVNGVDATAPEALYVYQSNTSSYNVISGKGNLNNYLQLNIQNTNNGSNASSDVVATANNGNEDSNYIDMGINNANFSGPIGGTNDAYLYSTGNILHIGNVSEQPIQFFVSGTNSQAAKKFELNPNNEHNLTGSLKASNGFIGNLTGNASTATTASNALTASSADSFFVRDNATVANTLTAQTLVVQTVTSSIVYSSGSNRFGNNLANVQQFTGSVSVTGSLSVDGSNVVLINQTSSMSVLSASYAQTASFALNVNPNATASYAIQALSASYATNAPYYVLTASYNADSASLSSRVTNVESTASVLTTASASFALVSSSFSSTSGSLSIRTTNLETTASTLTTASASFALVSSSYSSTSGSLSTRTTNLESTASVLINASASFAAVSSSFSSTSGSLSTRVTNTEATASSLINASASFALVSASFSSTSGSLSIRTTNLEATSSQLITASGSLSTRTTNLEATASTLTSASASFAGNINKILGNYATTGSNVFVGNQTVTGSLFTSGSNTLIGSTALTGTLSISGSTVQIGTNSLTGNTVLSGSLTVSGSQGVATPTINIFGDVNQTGYTRYLPVVSNIDTSISASYIFVSGSTEDLYFSQNSKGYNNVTRLRWLEGNLYTGLLNGGLITSQSSTVYKVSSGSGIIVNLNASLNDNPYPTIQYLNWGNLTASIAPFTASYQQLFVGIDSTNNIYAQGTPFTGGQFDTVINLGNVLFQNGSTINGFKTQPSVAYGFEQSQNVFSRAFGPLKLSGYTLAPSGSSTGSLVVGSGTAYAPGANYTIDPNNPSYTIDNGTSTSKIFRYYQSGSSWVYNTNAGAGFATIDPANYSDNGTLTSVGAGNWSIQRVFYFPNSVTKAIIVYYGNEAYATEADAIANIQYETFVEAPNTAANAIYLGAIVINGNGVFTNASTYKILAGGLFRQTGGSGGGGSLVTQTLSGLSDVAISGPTDLQPFAYSTTAGKWINTSTISASVAGNATSATSASYASTSSWAITAIDAYTASYALSAVSASYILNATSASYALTAPYYVLTASYNTDSASFSTRVTNNEATASSLVDASASFALVSSSFSSTSGSLSTRVTNTEATASSLVAASSSFSTRTTNLEATASTLTTASASFALVSSSFSSTSGSLSTRTTDLEATASTLTTASASFALVSSSYSLASGSLSTRVTNLESTGSDLVSASSSFSTRVTNTEATASSLVAASASFEANYVRNSQTSSMTVLSASFASTASYVENAISASFALTASYVANASSFPYTGSAVISGSLEITGSVSSTGGFTGSLQGNADTATSASYADFATTASFATDFTASNILVNGTIIAQILNVQQVTSSIVYSSGSNIFGNLLTDSQQLTGSVTITGSLTVNDRIPLYIDQTASLSVVSASYAATASYANATATIPFYIGGSAIYYGTVNSSVNGPNNVFTLDTGSFTGAKFQYTVYSGSNSRAGEVFATWNNGNTQYMDFSTLDLGTTADVTMSVAIVTSQMQFNVQTNTSDWTIKSQATLI